MLTRTGSRFGWRVTSGFGDAYQVYVTETLNRGPTGRNRVRFLYDDHQWARRLVETRDLGTVNSDWERIAGPDGRPDHRCTEFTYTPGTDRFLSGLLHRERLFSTFNCQDGTVVSVERQYHDGQAPGVTATPPAPDAPSRGNVTHVWRSTGSGVIGHDGESRAAVVTSSTYETGGFADQPAWGRPISGASDLRVG